MNILIINGPNLNLLGIREPDVYGKNTYNDLVNIVTDHAKRNNINIEIKQSNHEGQIIDYLHEAYFNKVDGIILNAGAYTHYSYAIHDAISSINIPTVEVHLSDITKRESFRQLSVIKDVCVTSIMGKGINSYIEALDYLKEKLG